MLLGAVCDAPSAAEAFVEKGAADEVGVWLRGGHVARFTHGPGPNAVVGDRLVRYDVLVGGRIRKCIVEQRRNTA